MDSFRPRTTDLAAVTQSILKGGDRDVFQLFEAQGARAPRIVWSPLLIELRSPQLVDFFHICQIVAKPNGFIAKEEFEIEKFRALLPWILVLDVEQEGQAFRYSYYGEGIATIHGCSMLGRTSDEFDEHIGLFFTACYAAILQCKKPLLTLHQPPNYVFARNWERLMVPIVDRDGAVTRILVVNAPDNELRSGLEIIPDPVMILDAAQIVRFANKAARQVFDQAGNRTQKKSLFAYTGIDLDITAAPEELAKSGAVHDKVCLSMRNSLLQDFHVTISGAEFWGNAFYVITLRMDLGPR